MLRSEYWGRVTGVIGLIVAVGCVLLAIVIPAIIVNQEVKQDQYAVGYNQYEMEFTEVYDQGLHTLEVGEELIFFKRTLQDFKTDLTCLSSDRVELDLSISLQYELVEDDLIRVILRQFGSNGVHNKFLVGRILSSVSESCLKFTAEDYFNIRETINDEMLAGLVSNINDEDLGTLVQFFQLVNIQFPTEFSALIEEKQRVEQTGDTELNNRQSVLTDANTALLEAQVAADITLLNANNTAVINLNRATTDANAQKALWDGRAFAYGDAASTLGFNSTDMILYIQSINVQDADKLLTST